MGLKQALISTDSLLKFFKPLLSVLALQIPACFCIIFLFLTTACEGPAHHGERVIASCALTRLLLLLVLRGFLGR